MNPPTSLCVLGLGYIGLPTAVMFATHGLRVTGVDIDQEVVHILKNGGNHSAPALTSILSHRERRLSPLLVGEG